MDVKAKKSYIRIATRKVRLVANLIRGLDVVDAKHALQFTHKRSAPVINKLLASAIANAKHNYGIDESNLRVKEVRVNQGPTLKRVMPRSQGRAYRILKRMSHVELLLTEKTPSSGKIKKTSVSSVQDAKEVVASESSAKNASSTSPKTKKSSGTAIKSATTKTKGKAK